MLTEYSTISVPTDVKKLLEKAKGKQEWGEFMLNLYNQAQKLKSKKAFQELTESLTEEDLKNMEDSSKEFHERFNFR